MADYLNPDAQDTPWYNADTPEAAASRSRMDQQSQELWASLGQDPDSKDPQAIGKWLTASPQIQALMQQTNGDPFKAAAAAGAIPRGWKQEGNTIVPDNTGRNDIISAASVFAAPALGSALSSASPAVQAGAQAGLNTGLGYAKTGQIDPTSAGLGAASAFAPVVGQQAGLSPTQILLTQAGLTAARGNPAGGALSALLGASKGNTMDTFDTSTYNPSDYTDENGVVWNPETGTPFVWNANGDLVPGDSYDVATTPSQGAAAGGGGGGNQLAQALLKSLTSQQGLSGIGTLAGSLSKSQAQNRGQTLNASQQQDIINTQRAAEERAQMDNAWKRMMNADYVQNKQGYAPPSLAGQPTQSFRGMSTAGQSIPNFGTGPKASDASMVSAAQGLQSQVMPRLTQGSTLPPLTNASKLSSPSIWETLLGIAGPLATMAGQIPRRPITGAQTPVDDYA